MQIPERSSSQRLPSPEDELAIQDLETLKVFSDPLRQRVLTTLASGSRSVKQVAGYLNLEPHKLYYHFRLLEQNGLIRVTGSRVVSGIIERFYQVSALRFSVDPGLLSPGGSDHPRLEAALEFLLHRTEREIRHHADHGIIDLNKKPPHPDSLLGLSAFMEIPEDRVEEVYRRLVDLLQEIKTCSPPESGERGKSKNYALTILFYPTESESGRPAKFARETGDA